MKCLATAIIFTTLLCFFPNKVRAQPTSAAFRSAIATTYVVDDVGTTIVTHELTVTNRTPTTFIKQYALKTTSTDVRSTRVVYENKPLIPTVATNEKGTSIAIDFPDEVVGENKSRVFTISYATSELATIGGRVLEVHIPRMGGEAGFDDQSVILKTPTKFGKPARTSPNVAASTEDGGSIVTTFNDMRGQAISLLFGESQVYSATIRYHLENQGSAEALGQIALPPDTNFQRVYYQSLDPLPNSLKRDSDGNWIATYQLLGNSTTTVHLLASVSVSLQPNDVPPIPPTAEHLRAQEYWQVDSPQIRDLAARYSTPESIYSYVTSALSYSKDALSTEQKRLGALKALAQPTQAVCQEFTDSFIAIARAAGVPARRLTGYAYTQNESLRPLSLEGDVLHAWPEFFDRDAHVWRPVDPTWGQTTNGVDYFHQFDLNHIVFAINGASSTAPYAAGFYKTQAFNTKDIEITFGAPPPPVAPSFNISASPQKLLGIPIPGISHIIAVNETGQAYYDLELTISGPNGIETKQHIDAFLPFEQVHITIPTITSSWSLPRMSQVTATIYDSHDAMLYAKNNLAIITAPPIFGTFTSPTVVISVGISAIFLTLATGSVLVFRRKQQRFIRRKS